MVSDLRQRAWEAAATVCDPEIPVLTIADLGVLREVRVTGDGVEVEITPTYSGCPAMSMIQIEIETALHAAGIDGRVVTTLAPAWTTDWMSEDGKRKLRDYGIAPPGPVAPGAPVRIHLVGRRAAAAPVVCPRCGSEQTERLSAFGSTACKALYRCLACREPFEHFKPI